MKIHKIYIIILLIINCFFLSCEELILGPQPNFLEDNVFEPGMNVLGILRTDSIGNISTSFVHVEKNIAAVGDTSENWVIENVYVRICEITETPTTDTVVFPYQNTDSLFPTKEYRPTYFSAKAGITYRLQCNHHDFPEISSTTTIPNIPDIDPASKTIGNDYLSFVILYDSTAYFYDVYLKFNNTENTQRLFPEEGENTEVTFFIQNAELNHYDIYIYAYDKNLAEYYSSTNVFIKPNTYRPVFSNIDNGIGCFGSISVFGFTMESN